MECVCAVLGAVRREGYPSLQLYCNADMRCTETLLMGAPAPRWLRLCSAVTLWPAGTSLSSTCACMRFFFGKFVLLLLIWKAKTAGGGTHLTLSQSFSHFLRLHADTTRT